MMGCLILAMGLMVALLPSVTWGVELAEGLVAEWTFEEGEGNVVRDTSDNNNNGVLHNDPAWVQDGIGTALRFDGVDDYVDCGTTASVDLTETVSLEAWVNPAKPSAGEPLIVGKDIYAYGLTWSGSVLIFYITDGAWKCVAPIPMRQWSHVVGTYDGQRMLLYVNGELTSGFVMEQPHTPIKSRGSSVLIGRRGQGYFAGMVDNVRIFNRPLSEKEVQSHYAEEQAKLKQPEVTPPENLTGLARKVHDLGEGLKSLVIGAREEVSADLTIPRTVGLRFEMGGVCVVAEGAVLTIAGPVIAPTAPIFTGPGRVVFLPGTVEKVYPQWWGAVGDGKADDAAALQAAIDALPSGGCVGFLGGTYHVGSTVVFHSGITLEGPGRLRSRSALPALLQSSNPAARTGGLRISRMSFDGRAVNGDCSEIGIDLTNVCSSTLEDVSVSSCGIGIKMDGPEFCGYNNLMRLSIGACETGIELSNSAIKTSLIGSSIGAVNVGLLIKTTNELDVFGLSIEGFRTIGVDVQRGDTVHLQHLYFANGEESGTGIRIAPGVSECTIINPRFSRVATPIDDQAADTVVLDNHIPAKVLRTEALRVEGISAGQDLARNLRGQVTLAGAEQRAAVRFEKPEKDAHYFAVATVVAASEGVPAGATQVRLDQKAREGFEVLLADAPGAGREVVVDWILVR